MNANFVFALLFFAFSFQAQSQFLNSSANFSTLAVNLHFGDSIKKETREATRNFVQTDYLDDINAIERRAFKTVLDDEGQEFRMDMYMDSLVYVTKGRKTLAWVFFGLGIPCLIVPPAGAMIIFTSLSNIARDRVYMKVVCTDNLRGPDYKTIKFMLTYNALFVKNEKDREEKMAKKLPKLVRKYVADRVGKANAFYKAQHKKKG